MKYIKPMLALETFTFKPTLLDASSMVVPEPDPDKPTTKTPVIEKNTPTIELGDVFGSIFNLN